MWWYTVSLPVSLARVACCHVMWRVYSGSICLSLKDRVYMVKVVQSLSKDCVTICGLPSEKKKKEKETKQNSWGYLVPYLVPNGVLLPYFQPWVTSEETVFSKEISGLVWALCQYISRRQPRRKREVQRKVARWPKAHLRCAVSRDQKLQRHSSRLGTWEGLWQRDGGGSDSSWAVFTSGETSSLFPEIKGRTISHKSLHSIWL